MKEAATTVPKSTAPTALITALAPIPILPGITTAAQGRVITLYHRRATTPRPLVHNIAPGHHRGGAAGDLAPGRAGVAAMVQAQAPVGAVGTVPGRAATTGRPRMAAGMAATAVAVTMDQVPATGQAAARG